MTEYVYGPDDELPTGRERIEKHDGRGIPYSDIHPDNDCWPSHSMAVQRAWSDEIVAKLPEKNGRSRGTILTPAMGTYHAYIELHDTPPGGDVPMHVHLALDMAGWGVYERTIDGVRVYDPDGPLTDGPE